MCTEVARISSSFPRIRSVALVCQKVALRPVCSRLLRPSRRFPPIVAIPVAPAAFPRYLARVIAFSVSFFPFRRFLVVDYPIFRFLYRRSTCFLRLFVEIMLPMVERDGGVAISDDFALDPSALVL